MKRVESLKGLGGAALEADSPLLIGCRRTDPLSKNALELTLWQFSVPDDAVNRLAAARGGRRRPAGTNDCVPLPVACLGHLQGFGAMQMNATGFPFNAFLQ